MENALRACCKGIKIGKILIHRDGDNGKQVNELFGIRHRDIGSLLMLLVFNGKPFASLSSLYMKSFPRIFQNGMFCFLTRSWPQVKTWNLCPQFIFPFYISIAIFS